jgi:hypothetical protein
MKKYLSVIWLANSVWAVSAAALDNYGDNAPVFPPSEEEQRAMVEREKQLCQEAAEKGESPERCEAFTQKQAQTKTPDNDTSWKRRNRAGL